MFLNMTNHSADAADVVARGLPGPWTNYISLIFYPILLFLSTLGNILNVAIFAKQQKFYTKGVWIVSLAISDILVMWLMIPRYVMLHYELLQVDGNNAIFASSETFLWLQNTFYYTSDGILVLFSLERLIVFRFREIYLSWRHHARKALFSVLLVASFCAICNLSVLVNGHHWQTRLDCAFYDPPPWLQNWTSLHSHFEIIFPGLISLSLFLINICLLNHIKKELQEGNSLRRHSAFSSSNSSDGPTVGRHSSTSKPMSTIDRTLMGSVALYFITQLPATIINLLSAFPHQWSLAPPHAWRPIVWTITLVNYSLNSLVYALASQQYRQRVKRLFAPLLQVCKKNQPPTTMEKE